MVKGQLLQFTVQGVSWQGKWFQVAVQSRLKVHCSESRSCFKFMAQEVKCMGQVCENVLRWEAVKWSKVQSGG